MHGRSEATNIYSEPCGSDLVASGRLPNSRGSRLFADEVGEQTVEITQTTDCDTRNRVAQSSSLIFCCCFAAKSNASDFGVAHAQID